VRLGPKGEGGSFSFRLFLPIEEWNRLKLGGAVKIFLCLFLSLAALPAFGADKTDYSHCVPDKKADLDPGEFVLNSRGTLAVQEAQLLRHKKEKGLETAVRKMPGQSGQVQARLTFSPDGRPAELAETFPAYDSNSPSYQVTTVFRYAEGQCFVDQVRLKYFDGEYKGKDLVQFDRGLCRQVESAYGRTFSHKRAAKKVRSAVAAYKGGTLAAFRDGQGDDHFPDLMADCENGEKRYSAPSRWSLFWHKLTRWDGDATLPIQSGPGALDAR
jgi:hypothetical protein